MAQHARAHHSGRGTLEELPARRPACLVLVCHNPTLPIVSGAYPKRCEAPAYFIRTNVGKSVFLEDFRLGLLHEDLALVRAVLPFFLLARNFQRADDPKAKK